LPARARAATLFGMLVRLLLTVALAFGVPAPLTAPPGSTAYGWPLSGSPTVTRPFEPPPERWLPGHRGVDLGAAAGATVRSAGPGVVAFAGMVAGRPLVSVDHAGGLRTTYEPVSPVVRAGQPVETGTVLGTLLPGHAGCPVEACLHWGLRSGEVYLDPLSLLELARVRLLPL
jgi:murein DD-endopeptidase MepM/ murein hydrolase activator NlpD